MSAENPKTPRDLTTPFLVSSDEASRLLAISPRTLWSLTNRNALPHRRIGRSLRYCPFELHAWMLAGCPTEPGAADEVRGAMRKGVAS